MSTTFIVQNSHTFSRSPSQQAIQNQHPPQTAHSNNAAFHHRPPTHMQNPSSMHAGNYQNLSLKESLSLAAHDAKAH